MTNNPEVAVDPELLPLLSMFPSFDLSSQGVAEVRKMIDAMGDTSAFPADPDVAEDCVTIAGEDGADPALDLLIYSPKGDRAPRPLVLHMHGGGWMLGSALASRPANIALSKAINAIIVSVGYRLAPETRYPGQLFDCYAALKWMHDNASRLGGDPAKLAVMGESAGAALAASLALLARDRGEVSILHQHLIYPALDDRTGLGMPPERGLIWSVANHRFAWKAYLPENGDRGLYAAAGRAMDLSLLPSTFISVGALDIFAHENLMYAQRLMEVGVAVELHLYPAAFHGFDLAPTARVAAKARQASEDALRKVLWE